MLNFLLLFGVLAVAGLSLWGWGGLVRRWMRIPPLSGPLTATIGLGAIIFLGGMLNLARLAFGAALDALVVAGLALAALGWFRGGKGRLSRPTVGGVLAAIPILLAGWFLARAATPELGFNIHDDLERYFAYPAKMLATGTLAPNPLGCLGADTLGAQAFLQAFVAAHFPIEYIGSVDLAGCFLLCLALAGYGLPPGRWAATAIVAELLVVAVNPQMVNVSTLFSGVALVMAVTFLSGRPAVTESPTAGAPLLGLLYAGLLALKSTFAVFVAVHLLLTLVGRGPLQHRLKTRVTTGIWTLVFLSPWLALHAPLYLAAMKAVAPQQVVPAVAGQSLDLFSRVSLFYGSAPVHFTGLAVAALAIAVRAGLTLRRGPDRHAVPLAAILSACLTAGLVYLILVVAMGPLMFGPGPGTRYAIPVLIGTLPAALRMFDPIDEKSGWNWPAAIRVGGCLCVLLVFGPSLSGRVSQLLAYRSPLAFFSHGTMRDRADYLAYDEEVLHGSVRAQLRQIQALVPANEIMVVWVMTPFWLDFRRNDILFADPTGLAMPWARWPARAHYFLVQYDGFAVRTDSEYEALKQAPGLSNRNAAIRAQAFLRELEKRSHTERVLYGDHTYLLMQIREE